MESKWTMTENFNQISQQSHFQQYSTYAPILGLVTLTFWIVVCYLIWKLLSKKKKSIQNRYSTEENYSIQSESNNINREEIKNAYKPRWLFSYNEKIAYKKLKEILDKTEYTLFAKVRLLDLVEPIKGNPKYKTFLWKIQAKHVDFVLCDSKLVARYIIELDDSSHDTKERKVRDEFVDSVLESAGYKVLHTRAILEEKILNFILPQKESDINVKFQDFIRETENIEEKLQELQND